MHASQHVVLPVRCELVKTNGARAAGDLVERPEAGPNELLVLLETRLPQLRVDVPEHARLPRAWSPRREVRWNRALEHRFQRHRLFCGEEAKCISGRRGKGGIRNAAIRPVAQEGEAIERELPDDDARDTHDPGNELSAPHQRVSRYARRSFSSRGVSAATFPCGRASRLSRTWRSAKG